MDQEEIRRAIIIAMVSNDELLEQLVLKGGNALALVHKIGDRTSLDLDYSLGSDFDDVRATSSLIRSCLEEEFSRREVVVFDFDCSPKPGTPRAGTPHWWGGYLVKFKLIDRETYDRLGLEGARRQSFETTTGEGAKRTFKIDISKCEYTIPKMAAELQDFTVYVYTPGMIAAEKVRAICQQMPGYPLIPAYMKRARARDFYDIHSIVTRKSIDLATPQNSILIDQIFKAKGVSLSLLSHVADEATFDFHESGWAAVLTSAQPKNDFRHYFEFVCEVVAQLESLWKIDPPG